MNKPIDKFGSEVQVGDTVLISTISWGKHTEMSGVVSKSHGRLIVQLGRLGFYPLTAFRPSQRVIVGIAS